MIPSLIARELETSIVEYLATTFALSDDEAYEALTEFLRDEEEGIFRGPYLRVRLPFVDAPEGSDYGVSWTPPGFRPYAHQLAAWQRLSGRGRTPQPTLITTGTGSGKSEGFLIPVIDHCIWARSRGQRGIKALILYPMNALVTDQERRIAALLADPQVRAAGVRGGVWIGDDGSVSPRREMDETHLITDPAALQDDPPDILLTNYKMLDRLLTNWNRQRLWAANTRSAEDVGWEQPLTYLVLDEIHTYDGAQGTDVAMLLRRLGFRLGLSTPQSLLGNVGCVGTSATLGSSPTAAQDMSRFASRIFGVRFDASSIVVERRQTVNQVCKDIDFSLPVPRPEDVVSLDTGDLDGLAIAFTGVGFDDSQLVGDRLLKHHLTASLLRVASDQPREWRDAVAGVAQQVPQWGEALARDSEAVEAALEGFVALISSARGRTSTGAERPLFSVEVQVWIREVTRLQRTVSTTPRFRWADSPAPAEEEGHLELPSVYCTSCGRAGWLGVANKAAGKGMFAIERLVYEHDTDPYVVSYRDRVRTRTMLKASPDEPDVLWLDPDNGQVWRTDSDEQSRIPVLVGGMTGEKQDEEARDDAARRQQCPSCGTRDAIRFLGSRITTLASVSITQMFGSDHVAEDERKLLAFTDSVQDASHRAAFFSGRTHRFNLRATLSGALQSKGRVPLPRVAEVVLARADQSDHPEDDLFSLVPPDLLWEGWLSAAWEEPGTAAADIARKGLADRLYFDAVLEAGLRARLGRTLETTGTAVAEVLVSDDEWREVVDFATDALKASGLLVVHPDSVRTWAHGVIERLRLRGGIFHPFLDRYVADNGKRWWIWGGGERLAPKFPKGISGPAFFASAPSEEFDPIGGRQSWLSLWSHKVLGLEGPGADQPMRDLLHRLTELGILESRTSSKGLVWGIPPDRIEFVDIAEEDGGYPSTELRCDLCSHRHYTTPNQFDSWIGRPCLRLRCPGSYEPAPKLSTNYYRRLYRSARIRRVVAAEHTGLLNRQRREQVELGFKDGGRPDAPNVLAATPTLEMGIDIGDLSSVMLTAVPPSQSNYIQRVGRAGRKTGNAFITTFAEGDPRSLYFLQDPELMISGDIAAPNCYLDAIEILRRQYLAFLVDRAAEREEGLIPSAGEMPWNINQTTTSGLKAGGWLSEILEAGRSPDMVDRFVALFGAHLDASVADRLRQWAATDMRQHVERVIERWRDDLRQLENQAKRLREREKPLKALQNPSPEDEYELGRLVAELRYVAGRISAYKGEDTLSALEAMGLLPNYTLFDETVTLRVNLWSLADEAHSGDGQSKRFITDEQEFQRPASVAIRELAPGNYFYVDAHRVRIDAVDNGTEHEPAHSIWRVCPACAWVTSDASAQVGSCPRCGSPAVADQGALLTVLPMRMVTSTERETTARVTDENEERDREFHEVVVTVDIAPEDISAAYLNAGKVFGVEAARVATIRYLNLGLHPSRSGVAPHQLRIAGQDISASLFKVCRHCGSVYGIRGDTRDPDDSRHHRAWCKVRSGARKELWDELALVHELVTEAVRILLPVAEFEAPERLASFKAALHLGLRDSFGGDPSHLRVIYSDFPAPGGDPDLRNRYVVIHDTVPGGTGYLPRLADPERLHQILSRAAELIATCDCQTRGKPGCHKCLYTDVYRGELPLVTREVALALIDEILAEWKLERAASGTITGVNLTPVRQSELERMFKALLHRWAKGKPVRITSKPDPDHATLTRFDIRFQDGPHWELREQVNLANHATVPDFYATRADATGTAPVAIYLDGWEFHGAKPEQVDLDARKRASLRDAGIIVWVLSWEDVRAALDAANHGSTVGAAVPLSNAERHRARSEAARTSDGDHQVFNALSEGVFDQLMTLLRYPERGPWKHLAAVTALAPAPAGTAIPVESIPAAVAQAAAGQALLPAPHPTDLAAIVWTSQNGLPVATILDRNGGPTPTVVTSIDTGAEPDKSRWSDWLRLGNLFQFLDHQGIITTTRSHSPTVSAAVVAEPGESAVPDLSSLDAALQDVFDEAVLPLARGAAASGFTDLVVGHSAGDANDTVIEIAWPEARVGILPSGGARPEGLDDWDLRPPDQWTIDELTAVLAERTG